ncbi:MAG: hypothetical protein HY966_06120, partial [Ignavibacteriales bacterium]|nr:hypothetical protein [Ignavibacteriales bacterium]
MVLLLLVLVSGCGLSSQFVAGKGNKYVYTYRLVSPFENDELMFQDDSIIVQFQFDEAAIKFQLQNLSFGTLVVDYSNAALGIDDQFHPVRFSRTLYKDTTVTGTSVPLPSMAYIR